MPILYILLTVLLTVYGQLVVKWQVARAGSLPAGFGTRIVFLLRLLANPWVLSGLGAALLAALSWMAALTRFDLSFAYPFMGLAFVLVLVFSALFFGEPLTLAKVVGLLLVIAGLIVTSRSR